jgi:DNA-binding PadR family transcriptional regulator
MTKRSEPDDLLLGEWACLGVLYPSPMHGFAVAAHLAPDADIGRVWSLSRPLTYRSLDQLEARGFVAPIAHEPGKAGPNRTVLAATRSGRARLRSWVRTPVEHLRDLRSELLLKLVLATHCDIDLQGMLAAQLEHTRLLADALSSGSAIGAPHDPVMLWRSESANAAVRFLERLQAPPPPDV